jgi:hypothetical protein
MLFQQRRSFAFGFRFLEGLPRLHDFLDLGAGDLVANAHGHGMYGGTAVQGKEVARVHRLIRRIQETLLESHMRDIAAHVHFVSAFQRGKHHLLAVQITFYHACDLRLGMGVRDQPAQGQQAEQNSVS